MGNHAFAASVSRRDDPRAIECGDDAILADYDDLEAQDILAVLDFAARLSHIKRMRKLSGVIP